MVQGDAELLEAEANLSFRRSLGHIATNRMLLYEVRLSVPQRLLLHRVQCTEATMKVPRLLLNFS